MYPTSSARKSFPAREEQFPRKNVLGSQGTRPRPHFPVWSRSHLSWIAPLRIHHSFNSASIYYAAGAKSYCYCSHMSCTHGCASSVGTLERLRPETFLRAPKVGAVPPNLLRCRMLSRVELGRGQGFLFLETDSFPMRSGLWKGQVLPYLMELILDGIRPQTTSALLNQGSLRVTRGLGHNLQLKVTLIHMHIHKSSFC